MVSLGKIATFVETEQKSCLEDIECFLEVALGKHEILSYMNKKTVGRRKPDILSL